MQQTQTQEQTYQVGHITFIVTPIYKVERNETMYTILLKLMKADSEKDE